MSKQTASKLLFAYLLTIWMMGFPGLGWAISGAVVTLVDSQGTPVPSGTLKLTEQGGSGFFLISDNDGDAEIGLVDLDGKAIPEGRYVIQIEDRNSNVVRGGIVWVIRDNEVFEVDANDNEVALAPEKKSSSAAPFLALGGGALLVAAAVGAGGGDSPNENSNPGDTGGESNPEDETNPPPPAEPATTSLAGTINCNAASDPSNLAGDIGTVGGSSEVVVDGSVIQVTMPVGGSDLILNGSTVGNNFSVSGFGIVDGISGVGVVFAGVFNINGGLLSGQLQVGNNGALPDAAGAAHPGVIYSCGGNLAPQPA